MVTKPRVVHDDGSEHGVNRVQHLDYLPYVFDVLFERDEDPKSVCRVSWRFVGCGVSHISITPRIVRSAILAALEEGWDPSDKAEYRAGFEIDDPPLFNTGLDRSHRLYRRLVTEAGDHSASFDAISA